MESIRSILEEDDPPPLDPNGWVKVFGFLLFIAICVIGIVLFVVCSAPACQ